MRKSIITISALALAAATGIAVAAPASNPTGAAAQQPARAERGQPMTRAALEAGIKARFDKVDANKDGVITRAEFDAHREALKSERQARAKERRDRHFAALDTNKDDQISRAEFDAPRDRRAEAPRAGREGPRAQGKGFADRRWRGPGAHGPRGAPMVGAWFDRLDADKDGRVSLTDMLAKPLERFDAIDTDRNGTISPEERAAAREKMRARWQGQRQG